MNPIPPPLAKLRPDASLPDLLPKVRRSFEDIPDKRRQASVKHSMPDTLMAGLAIFSLKPLASDVRAACASGRLDYPE